jgi:hypothetical protein
MSTRKESKEHEKVHLAMKTPPIVTRWPPNAGECLG